MNLLFLTTQRPFPPFGGGPLRIWHNITALQESGNVHVVLFSSERVETSELPDNVGWTVLYCSSAILHRISKRILNFIARKNLLNNFYYNKKDFRREIGNIIDEKDIGLVIFEDLFLYYYSDLFTERDIPIVYDAHDVQSFLFPKIMRLEKSRGRKRSRVEAFCKRVEEAERGLIRESFETWVCSEDEAGLARQLGGESGTVRVAPNSVDASYYENVKASRVTTAKSRTSNTILFPAAFYHAPNRAGAAFVIDQLAPKIRQHSAQFQIWFVGRSPSMGMRTKALFSTELKVTGTVPDVRPFLENALCVLVPIFQGGGTRIKILEAWASFCPVVSTSKGAEGLDYSDGETILIANSAEAMLEKITYLFENPSEREILCRNAYELYRKKYSWQATQPPLAAAAKSIMKGSRDLHVDERVRSTL